MRPGPLVQSRQLPPRPLPAPRPVKTIPFDYVFELQLTGQRDAVVQDVVAVSVEGVFVATDIGYALEAEEQRLPLDREAAVPPRPPVIATIRFPTPPQVSPPISGGVIADPPFRALVLGAPGSSVALLDLRRRTPDRGQPAKVSPSGEVLLPARAKRGRQARWLLVPLDLTHDFVGPPLEVLRRTATNGITTFLWPPALGPDPTTGKLPAPEDERVWLYGPPEGDVRLVVVSRDGQIAAQNGGAAIPLDRLDDPVAGEATGRAEVRLARPLEPGDTLLARLDRAPSVTAGSFTVLRAPSPSTLALGSIQRSLEAAGFGLTDGFRVSAAAAALVEQDLPFERLSEDALAQALVTGARSAEGVSFLYSIDLLGSGRELQNRPIHSIAGLGAADGDRPFRPLARPMRIEPRSSIRIQVQQLSGPAGRLQVVLQGYKLLGSGDLPT